MHIVIDSDAVHTKIADFKTTWTDIVPQLNIDWRHTARLMASKLSAAWSKLGFVPGKDFLESETIGQLASIAATIIEKGMICQEVMRSIIELKESINAGIMVIVYGDAECDCNPDEDSEFTLVLEELCVYAEFNRSEDAKAMLSGILLS